MTRDVSQQKDARARAFEIPNAAVLICCIGKRGETEASCTREGQGH